jgi:6-pyruvoyltetrahydropterin/6-carboxytetrahydropterin synthase
MLQQFYPVAAHSYKYELNKDMNFAAAHFVPHQGAGACADVHGHTYFVNVTIVGNELNEQGFLVNFSKLKKLVHGRYDHTLMNDHEEFTKSFTGKSEEFPTTEIVAKAIFRRITKYLAEQEDNDAKCLQVIVRETPTSYVTYKEPIPISFNNAMMANSITSGKIVDARA